MRDHSHHIELSRDEAVEQMLSALAKEGFGESASSLPPNTQTPCT